MEEALDLSFDRLLMMMMNCFNHTIISPENREVEQHVLTNKRLSSGPLCLLVHFCQILVQELNTHMNIT